MVLREHDRVTKLKTLLKDTITLLCKNGLEFSNSLSLEALIGVTLDEDQVVLVSINELVKHSSHKPGLFGGHGDSDSSGGDSDPGPGRKRRRGPKRRLDVSPRLSTGVTSSKRRPAVNSSNTPKDNSQDPTSDSNNDDNGADLVSYHGDESQLDDTKQDDGHSDEQPKGTNQNTSQTEEILFIKQEAVDSWDGAPSTSAVQPHKVTPDMSDPMLGAPEGAAYSSNMSLPGAVSLVTAGDIQEQLQMSGMSVSQGDSQQLNQQQGVADLNSLMPQTKEVIADVLSQFMTERTPRSYAEENKVKVVWDEKRNIAIRTCCVDDCTYSTPYRSTMSRHQRRHANNFTLCQTCGKRFVDQSELQGHVQQVHENTIYYCHQCGKTYMSRAGLGQHMRQHRKDDHEFVCQLCGRGYDRLCNLRNHINKEHDKLEDSEAVILMKHDIEQKFQNAREMARQRSKQKVRTCKFEGCDYTTPYRASIIRHYKRHHEKSYMICPLCNNKFVEMHDFRCHLDMAHGKGQVTCENCGKKFTTKKGYQQHMDGSCKFAKGRKQADNLAGARVACKEEAESTDEDESSSDSSNSSEDESEAKFTEVIDTGEKQVFAQTAPSDVSEATFTRVTGSSEPVPKGDEKVTPTDPRVTEPSASGLGALPDFEQGILDLETTVIETEVETLQCFG